MNDMDNKDELTVETHQHELSRIGFTSDMDVIITFHNDPFNGEVILPANTFKELHKQWLALPPHKANKNP